MGHSDSDDDSERRLKRKRKSSRKHESRKRERRRRSPSPEMSSSSDSSSRARRKDRKRRKKEKKHRKKAERRERKQSKKERRKQQDNDESSARLERNYHLTNTLQSLVELQLGMATELPIILIRMADGTSFNLDQMPDARVSAKLQQVLASLSPFGVERDDAGSWSWNAPSGGKKGPLLLLRIVRSLLDQIGITMEAVQDYETRQATAQAESMKRETASQALDSALWKQTVLLLQQFQKESSEGPTLAQELASLVQMITSGESVSLDGLTDIALRQGIESLFQAAGLEKSEMEDSDGDDSEEEEDDDPVFGYGLADEGDNSNAIANLTSILETCKAGTATATKRTVKGPMMPPQEFNAQQQAQQESDDEEDEGPAPIGSETAKRRVQRGPSLPPEVIKAMAEKRKRELAEATGVDYVQAGDDGEREQWMLEPGEHDLLQGIKTGNAIKSRNFENKKKKPRAGEQAAAAPVDPSVQAEVDAIMEMQREARGPSLMEQHREQKAQEKALAAKGGKADWKWNRDKDLDAGRRVDKNALNMVMGGAAGNLKDKFQGGLSRGFM